jgi:hypothetical protein
MVNIGRINKCLFQFNHQILTMDKCFRIHGKNQMLEQYPLKIQQKVSPILYNYTIVVYRLNTIQIVYITQL